MEAPQLGQLIKDGCRRDAIHIAVAPVMAAEELLPGQHIGFVKENNVELVGVCENPIGIVDPFLGDDIQPGQRFWLFLYPNTITSLHHVWTHPTFAKAALKSQAGIKEKLK